MSATEELTQAIRRGDVTAVDQLLTRAPQFDKAESPLKVSFFMMALYNGQRPAAQVFLQHGHTLTLHEAAAWADADKLAALLKAHPELVNSFSVDGFQPLGLACFFGHQEAVKLLLQNGANMNDASRNFQQVAPLHSAAALDNTEICRLLLEKGADENARQQGGFTPLHAAAQNGNAKMVRLFLAHGADVNARTSQGLTPLKMAKESKNQQTIRLLQSAGGME